MLVGYGLALLGLGCVFIHHTKKVTAIAVSTDKIVT